MDKTSKLFLREQIRRIQDLNGRIDSGRYIIEQVTPELRKALESIDGKIRGQRWSRRRKSY